ncbi:hydroxyacid dehydrogenase [Pseudothermotoga thermarum]|uniref:D-isomer specific 2-hydroxyacid dehydrogenase NAD-binding protein n=1 Tax=Pseudothermotoga thermarum DSM 5069 TaxID=688269 RepID=F7YXJ7_9THEM|nr:hydroxyacid dehydrogenase [Pseudothermotoga thermarum]AEH50638.1 D-isomer specific 2-hydroxyacid dehydrogenase NAD-binding protein [Pseudothermotoga thermarum DSM 5069]
MAKVMIIEKIHESGVKKLLEAGHEVIYASSPDPETVAKEIGDVEGVIVRTSIFNRKIIENASKLRVIARHGVGVDNIDVEAASQRGIWVVNTPTANASSVAEATIMFILALAKRFPEVDKATRQGNFKIRDEFAAIDLEGKTLGIIGLGRIGTLVAKKCQVAFSMKVLAYDPYVDPKKAHEVGAALVSLEELLKESDFVSIHAPLTKETEKLIGEEQLKMMKRTAYIINMARGPLWDEQAVLKAVNEGWISGAATDVFVEEPPKPDHPFFKCEKILLTPHMAALTKECVIRMAEEAAEGILEVLSGKQPKYPVNYELLRKYGKI